MRTAFLGLALVLLLGVAVLVGKTTGAFSDQASVSDNTFTTASCFPAWWWDADYLYRKQITVTTGAAGVDSGYSAMISLNHASLVGDGKSQSDGDDVRVVYWNAGSCNWTELDRALDEASNWNSTSSGVWFKLEADISASSSDDNYYLYYGNATATNPPANKSNVYLYWDDFESYTTGSAPTGWTVISGNHQVVNDGGNKIVRSTGSTSGRHVIYKDGIAEADVLASSRVRTNDVTNVNMGPAARVTGTIESNSNYYTFHFRRTDNNDHIGKVVNGTWGDIVSTAQTPSNNTWYRYGIGAAGSNLKGWFNTTQELSTTDTSIPGAGSVGIYNVFGSVDAADTIDADNFIARLYVEPEPTTGLGAEQPKP
jgi:predicted ribosomally synthesized peptide with SipW-like signal peptide